MSHADTANPAPPWTTPWWRPAPGQGEVLFYLVVVHLMAITGLILFPLPGLKVFLVAFGLAALGSLGTTVCYHRAFAHKAVRLNPWVEQVFIFLALFNGGGAPRTWVSNHRKHHANSDTPADVSSPRHGGFWWAHLFWLYQMPDASHERWSPDMDRFRYNVWEKLHVPLLTLSVFWGIAFGWAGMFWIGAIRLVWCLHMQCFVNSLLHMGPEGEGGEDSSVNVWWLGPLQLGAWGENWHRNHHAEASAARFGRTWYQTDIGWYTIRLLEKLGLAADVRLDRTGPAPRVRSLKAA